MMSLIHRWHYSSPSHSTELVIRWGDAETLCHDEENSSYYFLDIKQSCTRYCTIIQGVMIEIPCALRLCVVLTLVIEDKAGTKTR